MYRFLIILLLLDAVVLAAAVLLQAGKGGGLAASFGGAGSSPNSLLGSREAGNLLTKTSWWSGGIYIALAFVLSLLANKGRTVRSVLDPITAAPTSSAPAPVPTTGATQSQSAPLQPITPPPAAKTGGAEKEPAKSPPPTKKQ